MRIVNNHLWKILWLCVAIALVAVYSNIAVNHRLLTNLYNSDALYLPAFYQDLVSGYSIVGWRHPPAPYFFPDMLLYVFLNGVVGNFHLAIMLFGAAQSLGFVAGWLVLIRVVYGSRKGLYIGILCSVTIFLLLLATGQFLAFWPILQSGYHFGVSLSLVFLLIVVVRLLKNDRCLPKFFVLTAVLLACSVLLMLSDALYLVQFIFPVLLSIWFMAALSLVSLKHSIFVFLGLTSAIPISLHLGRRIFIFRNTEGHSSEPSGEDIAARFSDAVMEVFQWKEADWWPREYGTIFQWLWVAFVLITLVVLVRSVRRARPSVRQAFSEWKSLLVLAWLAGNVLIIAWVSFTLRGEWLAWISCSGNLALLWLVRTRQEEVGQREKDDIAYHFVLLFFLLCPILNILAVFVMGGSTARYFSPAILIPIFFGWPFLAGRNPKIVHAVERPSLILGMVGALIGLAVWLGVFSEPNSILARLGTLNDYYPEFVECLDNQTRKRNLRYGMAQYWRAKYITMLSKNDLHVVQVRHGAHRVLTIDHLINNFNWYNHDFEFIVTEEIPGGVRNLYAQTIIDTFGEPADSFVCEDLNVLVYNRPEDDTFRKQFRREFYFEASAAELPSNTGSLQGQNRIAREGVDAPGSLTFGPYIDVFIGNYQFDIYYFASGSKPKDEVGKWEVVFYPQDDFVAESSTVVKKGTFQKNGDHVLSKTFTVRGNPLTPTKVEIRIVYKGTGTLQIEKLVIRRTG